MENSGHPFRVGIMGAGHIARKMAATLREMDEVEAYAVAARDLGRAQVFASEFGMKCAYGSYAELVNDPDVDLVYIATPNSLHYTHARLCLEHGRPVLCEKPFTLNAREAQTLVDMSHQCGVLIAEAIWTRYLPLSKLIVEEAHSGIIGQPMALTASLCYPVAGKERITSPALGGGALLDLGVYALNFASMVFGTEVESVASSCMKMPSGVDAQDSITLAYTGGRMAVLHANVYCAGDRQGIICGERGYLVADNINNPLHASIYAEDHSLVKQFEAPRQITGFEYQVHACIEAIRQGRVECTDMPHAETLRLMRLMDALRQEWGVRFPADVGPLPG